MKQIKTLSELGAYRGEDSYIKHIIISWIIFSILYWIAAYHKPFHVDEFFSWVYVERSSFKDIMMLKDSGIGHPPLFHLLQKVVQTTSPSYHFLEVRLINYLAGSAFMILFTGILLRHHWIPVFCHGIACSAGLLNIFVFSRMWGLVTLCALLALRTGEAYANTGRKIYIISFFGACVAGFLSDYSFILLVPYALSIFSLAFNRSRLMKRVMGALVLAGITSPLVYAWTQKDAGYLAYYLPASLTRMTFEAANSLLNLWFAEAFLIFVLLIVVTWIVGARMRGRRYGVGNIKIYGNWSVIMFGVLILGEALIRFTPIRTRHLAPFVIVMFMAWLVTGYFVVKKHSGSVDWSSRNARLLSAIFGAMIILIAVNPFFWRELRDARFLSVLFPFAMYFLFLNTPRSTIVLFSAALIVSGALFISSKGIGDYFPPPSFEKNPQPVYQNVFAYSTQYMKSPPSERREPLFLDLLPFKKYCRVCMMGLDARNGYFEGVFDFVVWDDYDLSELKSKGYSVVSKKRLGLSWLDKVQFSYLTPIYPRFYSEYILAQEPEANWNAPSGFK